MENKTRDEKIDFLRNHFRYNIMNGWNALTSYAAKVKIYEFVPRNLLDNAYDILEEGSFYQDIEDTVNLWEEENPTWRTFFNGRSSGYLVLARRKDNSSVDSDDDFEDWTDEEINNRFELVSSFDNLVEGLKSQFIEICKNYHVIEKTVQKEIKVKELVERT